MGHGTRCLSAVVASLLVSGAILRAARPIAEGPHDQFPPEPVALTTSQHLLETNSYALARFLETARPAPVSAEDKARALDTLPPEGAVTRLNASARRKLAAVTTLLRATGRESVYEIKVIAVPQAGVAIYARAVILISEATLLLVDAEELQALVAHEVGHEYVWTERESAFKAGDRTRLKDLELTCDGIAIVMLQGLGMDASRLMSGLRRIDRFNREQLGTANNESNYPPLAQRQAFARAMAARGADR